MNDSKSFWLAKMALLSQNGDSSTEGPKPTDEELAMLYDDQLDFNRKQQVLSHLNVNPELMQQWLNLIEILNVVKLKDKQSIGVFSKIIQWITSWQGLAGGILTASLVVVFVIKQLPDEIAPGIDLQPELAEADNSTDAAIPNSFVSPDLRAIASGFNSTKIIGQKTLPHEVAVESSSLDSELYQNYYNLGSFIARELNKCTDNAAGGYKSSLQSFLKLTNKISSTSFIPLNANLSTINKDTSQQQFCSALNEFLLSEF